MSVSAQEQQERVPVWQVLFDDFYLLFLVGVVVPFVFYTVWGLIDVGSIPMAKPVAMAAAVAPPPAPAGAIVVNATMNEFTFTLAPNSVPAGKPVRFNITNAGKIEHELVIEKAGAVNQPLTAGGAKAEAEAIAAGATAYLDWTFAEAGQYQIACHVPGHYEAGMVTKITVTK